MILNVPKCHVQSVEFTWIFFYVYTALTPYLFSLFIPAYTTGRMQWKSSKLRFNVLIILFIILLILFYLWKACVSVGAFNKIYDLSSNCLNKCWFCQNMVFDYFQLSGWLVFWFKPFAECWYLPVWLMHVTFMSTSLGGKPRVQSRFRENNEVTTILVTFVWLIFIKADGNINMYINESQNSTFLCKLIEIHTQVNTAGVNMERL